MRNSTFINLIRFSFTFIILSLVWQIGYAQANVSRFFPETGHYLTGEFLAFYESIPNPELIFGVPITEAFPDPQYGGLVQYLERARLELDVNAANGREVHRSPLGEMVDYQPGDPLTVPVNPDACRCIEPSQYDVCYAFLEFYEEYGGRDQFGLPTTNMELQSGRIVQRFQYAIFEWHPEMDPGHQVVLSDLGRTNFYQRGFNNNLLLPIGGGTQASIDELVVYAFPGKQVVIPPTTQTLHVIVMDQYLQPVSSAAVQLAIKFPNESDSVSVLPLTDGSGITSIEFPVSVETPGMVEIFVTVNLPAHTQETRTSYRISLRDEFLE